MANTPSRVKPSKGGVQNRAAIDNETVKALLFINGGGAVALLAMFSTVFKEPVYRSFAVSILVAVLLMMIGLVCAVVHNIFRRKCSKRFEKFDMKPPPGTLWGRQLKSPRVCVISRILRNASIAAFFCAGACVAITGLVSLLGTPS